MFTAQQYRAKTAEDGGFPGTPRSPGEDGEFRALEQTRTTLAENEQWLAHNADKVLPTSQYEIVPTSEYDHNKCALFVKEDEYFLPPPGHSASRQRRTRTRSRPFIERGRRVGADPS